MCAECELATSLESLLDKELLIPTLAIVMGCGIAMIAIVCGTIKSVATSRHRERTRRELAAYVAEGTLDPDKAIAMIEAGNGSESC
jgi:hypothetical protein